MTEPISLHWVDWAIIIAYILFSLGVGIYFSKRAASSTEEYFLSGRSLPWWLVGTSMVATTFAADTPLAITEFVRGQGIWQNWFWVLNTDQRGLPSSKRCIRPDSLLSVSGEKYLDPG